MFKGLSVVIVLWDRFQGELILLRSLVFKKIFKFQVDKTKRKGYTWHWNSSLVRVWFKGSGHFWLLLKIVVGIKPYLVTIIGQAVIV